MPKRNLNLLLKYGQRHFITGFNMPKRNLNELLGIYNSYYHSF